MSNPSSGMVVVGVLVSVMLKNAWQVNLFNLYLYNNEKSHRTNKGSLRERQSENHWQHTHRRQFRLASWKQDHKARLKRSYLLDSCRLEHSNHSRTHQRNPWCRSSPSQVRACTKWAHDWLIRLVCAIIKVYRNPNFTEWFNITLFGKVVDNARTRSQAVAKAEKLKREHKVTIVSR